MRAKHPIAAWVFSLGFISFLGLISSSVACSGASELQSRPAGAADTSAVDSRGSSSAAQSESGPAKNPDMTIKLSKSHYDVTPLARDKVAMLAKSLSPESYRVTQASGTEPAFCGNLVDNHKEGTYVCVVCGLPLFSSDSKFNSGTGWPSFFQPFDPMHVTEHSDDSLGMRRTEINCARCTAHLGHVFEDGPRPTGLRYCLNSAALKFFEKGETLPPESRPQGASAPAANASSSLPGADGAPKLEVAYFAGGCFWGIEHYFDMGVGVISAESGYMQGKVDHPDYQLVCSDTTGHAETVKVTFDPSRITYRRLLEAFFVMHDPTQLNYQGPDYGEQYRSGIFTVDAEQDRQARACIAELAKSARYGTRPIVTVVEPAKTFWPAEEYHQNYIAKTGRSCHVKNPWKAKAEVKQ